MLAAVKELGLRPELGGIPALALAVLRYRHRSEQQSGDPTYSRVSRTSTLYAAADWDKRVRACLLKAGLNWDAFRKEIGVGAFQDVPVHQMENFEINTELMEGMRLYREEFGDARLVYDGLALAYSVAATKEGMWAKRVQSAGGDVNALLQVLRARLVASPTQIREESLLPANIGDKASKQDSLGFDPYVRALAQFLGHPWTEGPLTVSIEGGWGSGKTSFMLQLERALQGVEPSRGDTAVPRRRRAGSEGKGPLTVWFNAWIHEKDDALWASFALEFIRKVSAQQRFWRRWRGHALLLIQRFAWKNAWAHLLRAAAFFALALGIVGLVLFGAYAKGPEWLVFLQPGGRAPLLEALWNWAAGLGTAAVAAVAVLSAWIKLREAFGSAFQVDLRMYLQSPNYATRISFIEQFHKDFSKVISAYVGQDKVFVFIDDLDRCEVPKAADLMQAVNLLVSQDPRLIFIIGMDREKIAAGLAAKYEKLVPYLIPSSALGEQPKASDPAPALEFGYNFIEKFIQVPFLLPHPGSQDIDRYLNSLLMRPAESEKQGWFKRIREHVSGRARAGAAGRTVPPETRTAEMVSPGYEGSDADAFAAAAGPGPMEEEAGGEAAAQREVRETVKFRVTEDFETLRGIVGVVSVALEYNPRRIKHFVNVFRLRTFIGAETGLFDQPGDHSIEPLKIEQLAKFVAISLRWPLLLIDLESDPSVLTKLQTMALKGTYDEEHKSPVVDRWWKRKDLVAFLRARCLDQNGKIDYEGEQKWSLEEFGVERVLRVLPRVRTVRASPDRREEPSLAEEGIRVPEAPVQPSVETPEGGPDGMVPVRADGFLMGSEDGPDDERPAGKIFVPEFHIGVYPVTNTEYAEFVNATRRRPPQHWKDGTIPERLHDHPVVNVSWHDAAAYCKWRSDQSGQAYRLPTEAEWEKAARGTDGRTWPWGNEFDPARCNTLEGGGRGTTSVTQFPTGRSPYGCYDMAGNVWEWTSTLYKPYPYKPDDGREDPNAEGPRVLRGGSWRRPAAFARSASRVGGPPVDWLVGGGVRCVVAPQGSPKR